ncbi:universal stress protein [Actinomarinicola tropica]|uniref:Universal stress protein n=1 Tax=Actinomarinicola tropica TaxID=2789776 RepID=A0A5Q2RCV5_9ACTN|nr:universal stress protein [Actinomarinicola tropica]QGG94719.1 universal stress protein [Actinomarinicola tropica]
MTRIVVGVDGSESSVRALEWAVDRASRDGAVVEAVHAWHVPYVASSMGGMPFDVQMLADGARATLDEVVGRVDASGLPEPVVATLREGAAAPALVEASHDADLVVVGSRGHGGFVGLLLGSVSQQVASHARCPVVIIPADADADPDGAPSDS